jgi:hypothetical protein
METAMLRVSQSGVAPVRVVRAQPQEYPTIQNLWSPDKLIELAFPLLANGSAEFIFIFIFIFETPTSELTMHLPGMDSILKPQLNSSLVLRLHG